MVYTSINELTGDWNTLTPIGNVMLTFETSSIDPKLYVTLNLKLCGNSTLAVGLIKM